jgi:hypothetical protein
MRKKGLYCTCTSNLLNPDGASKQIGQQYCHHALQSYQIRMVLQNKSDNSNGHALKLSNFRLNLSLWRCLSQKCTHFRENFLGNENFRNFAKLLLIFAFHENDRKTVFVSTLTLGSCSGSGIHCYKWFFNEKHQYG